ncbi:MAG: nuclear transport factor 2 family protein [Gilvibacter sp.]
MKKLLCLLALLSLIEVTPTVANNSEIDLLYSKIQLDSTRTGALDQYWAKLARTVKEGDFDGYRALYHDDAVVIFAGGATQISVSISQAMESWKSIFDDTKAGKINVDVDFRLSQRIGNDITAHETGIFAFSSLNSDGEVASRSYVHFEMLFVKGDKGWLSLMEYQKSNATQEEWDALQ